MIIYSKSFPGGQYRFEGPEDTLYARSESGWCLGTNPTQGPQDDQAPAAAIEQVSSSGKMPEALPSQRRSTELGSST